MNDFTKDDLKEIYYAISECCYIPAGSEKPPLLIKIGNMIDNYCEHSWNPKHESGFVVCDKCGKVYAE